MRTQIFSLSHIRDIMIFIFQVLDNQRIDDIIHPLNNKQLVPPNFHNTFPTRHAHAHVMCMPCGKSVTSVKKFPSHLPVFYLSVSAGIML